MEHDDAVEHDEMMTTDVGDGTAPPPYESESSDDVTDQTRSDGTHPTQSTYKLGQGDNPMELVGPEVPKFMLIIFVFLDNSNRNCIFDGPLSSLGGFVVFHNNS